MTVHEFIKEIAPIIQKNAKKNGYTICSTVIAQAIIESWGKNGLTVLAKKYHNYFGMKCGSGYKGTSVNLKTNEEYQVGVMTRISDNFRTYPDMASGVAGYYKFITAKRYANLKTAVTSKEYAERLKSDGWATSSVYVDSLCSMVKKYNLTQYDVVTSTPDDLDSIALAVIEGKFSTGEVRKELLTKAGYDPVLVQKRVNEILKR